MCKEWGGLVLNIVGWDLFSSANAEDLTLLVFCFILKNENPMKRASGHNVTQVGKECFLKLGWLPGAIRTVLPLRKSVKDPKKDEKYNEVKNAIQVHLEKVKEMDTLQEAFHPEHMDKSYFLNDDGDYKYTSMSMGLKMKIEDTYNTAVNIEKYIQKLKLEMAQQPQLMHIQEEMKKTIREKRVDLVRAKVCYLVRRDSPREKQKQEEAAEETDNEAEAEEAEAEGDKVNKKSNSSDEEDDSSDDDDDFDI